MHNKQSSLLPATLPIPPLLTNTLSQSYLLDEELESVVSVALSTGQPLLLTGEPGSGKTQLAAYLAHHYHLGQLLKFTTKSSSQAHDLFYIYNTLGRFHAAQQAKRALENDSMPSKRAVDYITYNALGKAMILTHPKEKVKDYLPMGFEHIGPQRSVVLIDDINKAPRDFPNDILNELDAMYFRIPELGNVMIEADPRYQPIVVITCDAAKLLPDAFLRRCLYYHIAFPTQDKVARIVKTRMANLRTLHHKHEEIKNKTQQLQIAQTPHTEHAVNTTVAAVNETKHNPEIVKNEQTQAIIHNANNDNKLEHKIQLNQKVKNNVTVKPIISGAPENQVPNNQIQLIQTLEEFIQLATVRLNKLEAMRLAAQELLKQLKR